MRNKNSNFIGVLKAIHHQEVYLRYRIKGKILKLIARRWPSLHAKYEMKRQEQVLLRPMDITTPSYFHEKRMWLKYYNYNYNPLIAQCYNKYDVREYVASKGLSHILNDLYFVWDRIEDICWDELPEECVIKVANGCQGHVFKYKDCSFDKKEAIKTLRASERKSKYCFEISGDLFCYGTAQKIICERMLHSRLEGKCLEDFKFHCFNGKPLYLEYIKDRVIHDVDSLFLDMELRDCHDLEGEAKPGTIDPPPKFEEMKEVARILSEDFPYVRVDLYIENDSIVFGELTFTPYQKETAKSQETLGKVLDISNVENLLAARRKRNRSDVF